MTLFNCILFVVEPKLYIENRFGSVPYEFFQQYFSSYFDFGLIAATDPFEAGKIILHRSDNIHIFFFISAFVMCLIGLGSVKAKYALGLAIAGMSILTFASYQSLMNLVPSEVYAIERGINANGNTFITVTMQDREMIRGFKIGTYADNQTCVRGGDEYSPKEFSVTGDDPNGRPYPEQNISGYQLATLDKRQRYSKLTIIAINPTVTKDWINFPIKLF